MVARIKESKLCDKMTRGQWFDFCVWSFNSKRSERFIPRLKFHLRIACLSLIWNTLLKPCSIEISIILEPWKELPQFKFNCSSFGQVFQAKPLFCSLAHWYSSISKLWDFYCIFSALFCTYSKSTLQTLFDIAFPYVIVVRNHRQVRSRWRQSSIKRLIVVWLVLITSITQLGKKNHWYAAAVATTGDNCRPTVMLVLRDLWLSCQDSDAHEKRHWS